jgi:hypothetical protein
MRLYEILTEKIEQIQVDNKTVSVLCNPTVKELTNFTNLKNVRGLVDPVNGDTYWWAARHAIHSQAARYLGLDYKSIHLPDGVARLFAYKNFIDIVSGTDTFLKSRSIKYLIDNGMVIKYGKTTINLEELREITRKYRELNP